MSEQQQRENVPELSQFEIMEVVGSTWDDIKKIPNYVEIAGALLFKNIFKLAPAALDMFSFGHEGLAADSEELYKHPLFKRHARGVVNMLDTAIGMLGPDVSPLLEALKALGARHFEYGVLPAHYPIVGEALILTLETALGKKWTPKVKQGWAAIYDIVSTAMLEGANQRIEMENKLRGKIDEEEGEGDQQPKTNEEVVPLAPGEAPTTGDKKKKRMTVKKDKSLAQVTTTVSTLPPMPCKTKSASYQKAANIRSNLRRRRMMRKSKNSDELSRSSIEGVTKVMDEALSLSESLHSATSVPSATSTSDYSISSLPSLAGGQTPVSACMKERVSYLTMVEKVMDSWYTIKSIPNYKEVAGVLLFRNIFKIAPAAKGLFQFTKGYDEADEEALYKSRAFILHAKTVVKMLDAAINMLSDLDVLGTELEKLGARHVSYGVLVPHYDVVGQALLQTLELALGEDGWTETIKEGWTGIYLFVSTSMIRGAKDVAKEQYRQQEQTVSATPTTVVA